MTCSFASSTKSKRRIRRGKKHNKNKKKTEDLLGGSLERMSDILKEAKLKFGGHKATNDEQQKTDSTPPPGAAKKPFKHRL